ncbi:hypothetical protein [Kerstersia gyiorum]|uniref:hypothetical protein n=1 Tax=Kerstersia gyiorum TaxID=206506 RepID=UPI003B432EBC
MSYFTRLALASVAAVALYGCGGGGDSDTANPIGPGTEEPGKPEPEAPVSVGACKNVVGNCVEQLGVGDLSKLGDWTLDSYINPPKISKCEDDCTRVAFSSSNNEFMPKSSHHYSDGYFAMPHPALQEAGADYFYAVENSYNNQDADGKREIIEYGGILIGYPRAMKEYQEEEGVDRIYLTIPFVVLTQTHRHLNTNPRRYKDGFAVDEAMILKGAIAGYPDGYPMFLRKFSQGKWGRIKDTLNFSSHKNYSGFMIFGSDIIEAVNESTPLMCQNRYTIGKSAATTVHDDTMQCLVQWKRNDWFAINVPTSTTINNADVAAGVSILKEYIENAANDPNTDRYFAFVAKYTDAADYYESIANVDQHNLASLEHFAKYYHWDLANYIGVTGTARHWMWSVTNELNQRYDPELSLAQGRLVPRTH